jgi:hypothetical protein
MSSFKDYLKESFPEYEPKINPKFRSNALKDEVVEQIMDIIVKTRQEEDDYFTAEQIYEKIIKNILQNLGGK